MPTSAPIIVLTTCNSSEMATLIADSLVTKNFAACVNIINGVESVYQWQGKIEHDKEILLIVKTQQALFSQVEKTIQELHDYELPEIIAVPIEIGEKKYLDWILSATQATENDE